MANIPLRFLFIGKYTNVYADISYKQSFVERFDERFEEWRACMCGRGVKRQFAKSQEKVLMFSITGDRDAEILLKPLKKLNFNAVFFVIPTAYSTKSQKNDNYSAMEQKELVERCHSCTEAWKSNNCNSNCEVHTMESVSEALISIKRSYNTIDKSSVLITGSLHLVGAALSIIDPI